MACLASPSGRLVREAYRLQACRGVNFLFQMRSLPSRSFSAAVVPITLPRSVYDLASTTTRPVTEAKALHPAFYVDDQYSKAESTEIFGRNWFAAAHTAELAKSGDVKVVDVGANSFILTRDKAGNLNAFHNVCRHRGARVCSSSQKECKQIVCPYHQWAYRLDGTLKSTPPAGTSKERKENLGLVRVPGLETFAGIIFLNQSPSPTPFADVLGDLPEKLKRHELEKLELHGTKDYTIKGNWKLLAENFIDFYHINAVHPALSKFSKVSDHQPYQGKGQYVGFVTTPLSDCGGPGDAHHFNTFPKVTEEEQKAALFFHIFPNVSVTVYPHSMYSLIMLPTDDAGRTHEQLTLLMAPGAQKDHNDALQYKQKCQDLMDFVVNINDEDVAAIENLQRGLVGARKHNMQGEFLPEYDWPIHRFQNMVISGLLGEFLDPRVVAELSTAFEQKVQAEILARVVAELSTAFEQKVHAEILA